MPKSIEIIKALIIIRKKHVSKLEKEFLVKFIESLILEENNKHRGIHGLQVLGWIISGKLRKEMMKWPVKSLRKIIKRELKYDPKKKKKKKSSRSN